MEKSFLLTGESQKWYDTTDFILMMRERNIAMSKVLSGVRAAARRYPIATSVLICALFYGAALVYGLISLLFFPSGMGEYTSLLSQEFFLAFVAVGLLFLLGLSDVLRARGTHFFGGLGTGAYFLVLAYINLLFQIISILVTFLTAESAPVLTPPQEWIAFLLLMPMIGIAEEFFFRGMIAELFFRKYAKDAYGVWTATIASGVFFGLIHLTNLRSDTVPGVFVQCASACFMGMALSAVYYRSRNIWVVVFLHAFIDFSALLESAVISSSSIAETIGSYSFVQMLSLLQYLLVTLVLLRPRKVSAILSAPHPENGSAQTKDAKNLRAFSIAVGAAALLYLVMVALFILTAKDPFAFLKM